MSLPEKIIKTPEMVPQIAKTETYKQYFDFIMKLQNSVRSKAISES